MPEFQGPTQTGAESGKDNFAREVLRFEFSKRAMKNPRYSLRSFAKQLGVSHSLLSLVLNGHRDPSQAMIETLVRRLELCPERAALLRESHGARARYFTSLMATQPERISMDQFALISEWQHYAILSLLEIPDTTFDAKFIAKRLGVTQILAQLSMDRLVKLGIVFQKESGRWKQKSGPIIVENTDSTDSTRRFQTQMLEKAKESLDNDSMAVRDLSSTTFAMAPKHVPYALQRIREFRRQLSAELEAFGSPEEVYNLTVQLFPTSRRRNG